MGARPLARTIQEHVKKPMAEELLFGELQKGGVVHIDIDKNDDGKLAFKYEAEKPKKKPKRKANPTEEAAS
jgi:ATP-dependent Clp protease ATP-binding subunit ClpA